MNNSQKQQWNQFILENGGCFLQSWEWGEFQESFGRKVWPVQTPGLKGLIIKHNLPLGKNYLYCPRGPIGREDFKLFLDETSQIAKSQKSVFLKIELDRDGLRQAALEDYGLKPCFSRQPTQTIVLDISKPEQELLDQMHQKTRYNIRLAQKKGIEIEESGDIDSFVKLLKQTAKRDKFHLHPDEYYQKMIEQDMIKLFTAKYQGQVIAANLVCFFGQTATYLHGASDYEHRHLMASYLLQWQTILQAKEQGFRDYDFWGIDENKWPGITRFKKGFGGNEITYPGSFDLTFRRLWYRFYRMGRRISRASSVS